MLPKLGPDINTSVGDWGACLTCAALIDSGDWNGLLDRAVATWLAKESGGSPRVREIYARSLRKFLGSVYEKLREHAITGKTEPETERV